jgi:hypothetical protein
MIAGARSRYASSEMFAASPAPDSTATAKPSLISFSTTSGTVATRLSPAAVSLGTPIVSGIQSSITRFVMPAFKKNRPARRGTCPQKQNHLGGPPSGRDALFFPVGTGRTGSWFWPSRYPTVSERRFQQLTTSVKRNLPWRLHCKTPVPTAEKAAPLCHESMGRRYPCRRTALCRSKPGVSLSRPSAWSPVATQAYLLPRL